ncbi:SDR family NAD(P)-dependent oxidoreductase [Alkalihalobacillus sp. CinArs1]|uniref:SDR family NAD(P)-dependent oxidoreductase n=1 Tax=Alkalihalobacillus sp. CinArs1 TaxID=2995314 RepID=UPI0022DE8605|nr:SDR family NAD(P)-dependent oxidoreductase [Alkalihalobacillus sp. CinArs1]
MKSIVITGGGSGLGAELAKRWASLDKHVILVGRTKEKLETICTEIQEQGGSCSSYTCDISNYTDAKELYTKITNDGHTIEMLVNNAGAGAFGSLEDIEEEAIHSVIDTNVKGAIFLTKIFLPVLKQAEGRIMNIISTAGLKGKKHETVYVASKYAVRGFTESLWKELEGTGVSATAVYMGGMDTPFWHSTDHIKDTSRLKSPAEKAKQIIDQDEGQQEIFIDR